MYKQKLFVGFIVLFAMGNNVWGSQTENLDKIDYKVLYKQLDTLNIELQNSILNCKTQLKNQKKESREKLTKKVDILKVAHKKDLDDADKRYNKLETQKKELETQLKLQKKRFENKFESQKETYTKNLNDQQKIIKKDKKVIEIIISDQDNYINQFIYGTPLIVAAKVTEDILKATGRKNSIFYHVAKQMQEAGGAQLVISTINYQSDCSPQQGPAWEVGKSVGTYLFWDTLNRNTKAGRKLSKKISKFAPGFEQPIEFAGKTTITYGTVKMIDLIKNNSASIQNFLSDRRENLTKEAIIPMAAGVGTMTALHYGTKHYCPEATDLHKITGSMVKSSGVAAVILAARYKQEDQEKYKYESTFAETARNTIRVLAPGVVGAGTELIIQSQPVQDAIDTIENKLPESFVRVTKPVVEHLGKPVFDWFVATQIINFLNFLTSGPTDSTGSNS